MTSSEFNKALSPIKDRLFRYSYKLTQDMDNAKDLFQETLFRALKNKKRFQAGSNFIAWMHTIMKNQFINDYRKTKRKRDIINDSPLESVNIEGKVHNQGEGTIMMKELTTMIDLLEDGLKVPFRMNYKGYKYQEIADDLKLPIGTVKSRIHFARKELQRQIKLKYQGRPDLRA